jgi:hypothetical protein
LKKPVFQRIGALRLALLVALPSLCFLLRVFWFRIAIK